MEVFTLNRNFQKQDIIDGFESIIWTERYYGDDQVELNTPITLDYIQKIPEGIFLGIDKSDKIMIVESVNIEEGKVKASGIGMCPWLDNRFVRTTRFHYDKHWYITDQKAGEILWTILFNMACDGSPYLAGFYDIGVPNPQQLIVPGLSLLSYDDSGDDISAAVPFGPLYKAMREIATTYEVGMEIVLVAVTGSEYFLGFRSYKGVDRTSDQGLNPTVRFSPTMESFTDIKELRSIAALKTHVYTYAPGFEPQLIVTYPGQAFLPGTYSGFDLRALMVFADDITTDQVGTDPDALLALLNSRAQEALTDHRYVIAVDGEIVPESQFQFGRHYGLGDIIEVQGNSGVLQKARITEYIRSQDSGGEKAYPTVEMFT